VGAVSKLRRQRWGNNPGGTDVHFAVVFYGTTPGALSQAAQNQIRINPTHPDTVEGQMNIYDTVAFGPRVPIFNLAGRYTGEVRPIANWGPWRGTALGRPCSEYAWRTGPQALAQRR
jgi:hypothetical protein